MRQSGRKSAPLSVLALATLLLCSCAASDRPYRQLALNRGLRHDGWIIGIEQAAREEIGAPKSGKHDSQRFRPERLPWDPDVITEILAKPGYDRSEQDVTRLAEQAAAETRNRIFRNFADDEKTNIVTQVYESFRPTAIGTGRYATVDLFNAHDRDGSGVIGPTRFQYEESFQALEIFRERFLERVRERQHTHVVVLALGWHVDQVEAIHTYNLMLHNLIQQSDGAFRPLVVGLTWPSAWLQGMIQPLDLLGHVFSYFDKSRDADAIGATLSAHLLHDIILDEQNPLPVVAIGHSMGARMLSRAWFSARHLAVQKAHKELSLLICLQGAFSARRFLDEDPDEGHPYSTYAHKRGRIVLTTSKRDLANAAARILTTFPHVGGEYGLRVAQEHPRTFRILDWPRRNSKGAQLSEAEVFPRRDRRVLMIDAEKIVRGGTGGLHGTEVGPHNDFVDEEMGELLWTLIDYATH